MKIRWLAVLAALALVVAACGDDDTLGGNGGDGTSATSAPVATTAAGGPTGAGIQEAIDAMVASGISEEAAACYVNTLVQEFGAEELIAMGVEGAEVSPEMAMRALELFDECGLDIGDFGGGFDLDITDFRELASPRDEVDGPYTYGDDPDLDALWDACEAGSGEACDDLFYDSPIGSEYEAYGNTCGNRLDLFYDCSSLDE